MTNVFACLVHERQETVVDLVRNLSYLDPDSRIVLYNGGRDPSLLRRRFTVDGTEPLVHPDPKPLRWGYLHPFAVDCMRFALQALEFDTLTIVDSDQLLLRPGYSAALASFLDQHGPIGMLGNAPGPQPRHTRVPPAVTAWRERDLWLPYVRTFPDGESKFPHWTFWPSTVFGAAACRDLVRTFDEDEALADVLTRSKLWATEEIVLPTLVALLGHEVAQSPFGYDVVRFRVPTTPLEAQAAMCRPDVFWVHPVARAADDPVRRMIRGHHQQYLRVEPTPPTEPSGVALTLPILSAIQDIEGWLEDDEADVLVAGLSRALAELPSPHAVVEVGSFCGRATVVLGSVIRALGAAAHVHAIDPHDGRVGALDERLESHGPTLPRFQRSVARAGLSDVVTTLQQRSWETAWDQPVSFLLVDGLHDYASVSADFLHFEPSLVDGAYIAFHDYADYFPGVRTFVQELLGSGGYAITASARSMVLLRKLSRRELRPSARPGAPRPAQPLVSCVMVTYDRAHLVPQAVTSFLRQTHPSVELLVIDDGPESVGPLLPDDDRVRHIRLDRRQTVGAKRNLGCDAARGDLLANWDDDDWYAPWRIAYQVDQLVSVGADACGLQTLLYLDPVRRRAWRYSWPHAGRPWAHGASLLFTRDSWTRSPFPDTSVGEDSRMLWSRPQKRIHCAPDARFYVGMIHAGNTSAKATRGSLWTPCAVAEAHHLIGDDLAFYEGAFAHPSGVGAVHRAAEQSP